MKKTLLTLSMLAMSSQAFAWTQVAKCGTGDALEGMDVFTDGENVIVQILQYEDDGDGGTVVADEYRTILGDVASNPVDVNELMAKLARGESVSLLLTKEDSFSFGGVTSHAALLNVKLNPADLNDEHHYDRTTQLAWDGSVGTFFCSLPQQ